MAVVATSSRVATAVVAMAVATKHLSWPAAVPWGGLLSLLRIPRMVWVQVQL